MKKNKIFWDFLPSIYGRHLQKTEFSQWLETRKDNATQLLKLNRCDELFRHHKELSINNIEMEELIINFSEFHSANTPNLPIAILLFGHTQLLLNGSYPSYPKNTLIENFSNFNIFPLIIKYELHHVLDTLFSFQEQTNRYLMFTTTPDSFLSFISISEDFTDSQLNNLDISLKSYFTSFSIAHNKFSHENNHASTHFIRVFSFFLLTKNSKSILHLLKDLTDEQLSEVFLHLKKHTQLPFLPIPKSEDMLELFSHPQLASMAFKERHPFLKWCDIEKLSKSHPHYFVC